MSATVEQPTSASSAPSPNEPAHSTGKPSPLVGFSNQPEITDAISLRVQGTIPSWLGGGVLYRIGPGKFDITTKSGAIKSFHHWFDGLTMVHRFEIQHDGNATNVLYSNRETAAALERRIAETELLPAIQFANDPCRNLFRKAFTTFEAAKKHERIATQEPGLNNAGVTLTPNFAAFGAGSLVTKADANILMQIDPKTLDPLRDFTYTDMDARLKGALSAAHAKVDPTTREFVNYTLELGKRPVYHVFSIKPAVEVNGKPEVRILADVYAPPAYLHSFSMTRNYVVLILWPAHLSWNGAKIPISGGVLDGMAKWNPKKPVLFYVIARNGQGIRRIYQHPAFFCFHTVNAYEDDNGDIMLDLARYDDDSTLYALSLANLRTNGQSQPLPTSPWTQFRLPVTVDIDAASPAKFAENAARNPTSLPRVVIEKTFGTEWSVELPTFDPRRTFQPHSYVYGVATPPGDSGFFTSIAKLDITADASDTSKHRRWQLLGHFPSEPIFVPRPDGTDEDDGVVLSVVLDGMGKRSFLLVLDARTMEEIGRADMYRGEEGDIPVVVPFGFHGVWSV